MKIHQRLRWPLAALSLSLALALHPASATPIPATCLTGGFAIGCQAWTFRQYTVLEAIDKTAEAGSKIIEFYPGQSFSPEHRDWHFDEHASDEMIAQVRQRLTERGVRAVNYGVVGIPRDEAGARVVFDFARKLGLYGLTTESVDSIDTIEKLAKEYDVCVGFHDHQRRPDDAAYRNWDPRFILKLVKDRDRRIGACADTGHWVQSGLNPVDCLRILRGRIISVHLHDMNQSTADAHDVPAGTGVSDVAGILAELKRQRFHGNISIEYEYNWADNVVDAAQAVGFARGYGAAH